MKSALSTCRQCGEALDADAHAGICPACLVQVGIDLFCAEPNSGDDEQEMEPAHGEEAVLGSFGDYELLERIGRGGMGVVYKARQISLNRLVALKMILAGEFASRETLLRFRAEAESAAELHHPNIVPIYETGEADGQHYFTMEYIAGANLAELVRDGPLTADRAARYVAGIAGAIEHSHENGTLHRDLKPSNVLVDERDEPRVTDFGLAKKLSYDSALTMSGQLIGSPNFMPPEQASSKRGKMGRHSDVYGLGALLYHLLVGRPPFQAATLEETLQQVFELEPVSPRSLIPSVPRDLETICLKCLGKDPARRYRTAAEVAEELEKFRGGEPIVARPVHWTEKAWLWCRRKPLVAGLTAVATILLLALAIGGPIMAAKQKALADQSRRDAYASDLAAAWQSWEICNLTHAIALLERHRPRGRQADLREFTWHYLWNLCSPAAASPPRASPFPVFLSAVSRDGKRYASSGPFGSVTIWDVKLQTIKRKINTGETFAGALAFSPDGKSLVSTGGYLPLGASGSIQVWDLETGANLRKTEIRAQSGEFSPDGRWFAFSIDHDFVVLDVMHDWQEKLRKEEAHGKDIWNVSWSPDSNQLVSTSEDHTAAVWDASTGEQLGQLQGHALAVESAVFSPDGTTIVTAGKDKTVRFWDARTYVELKSRRYLHEADSHGLVWSQDERWLASASNDGLLYLQNMTTGSRWTLRGHSQSVKTIQFALNDRCFISASLDGSVRFWDLSKLPPNDELEGRRQTSFRPSPSPIAYSPDSTIVATVNHEANEILLWNTATGTLGSRIPLPTSAVEVYLPESDKGRISSIYVDDLVFVSQDHMAAACGLRIDARNSQDRRYRVLLIDVSTKSLVNAIPGREPMAVSPGGKRIAMQSEESGGIQVRDLSGEQRWEISRASGVLDSINLNGLAFSPDGKSLAAAGFKPEGARELLLLGAATGSPVAFLEGGILPAPIHTLAFTPDGSKVITCGFIAKIQIWDVRHHALLYELPGHTGIVRSLAVSPNGKTLATGSDNGVLKFWSLEQRAPLLTLRAHDDKVVNLRFSPDGTTLASGDEEGRVRLWRAPLRNQNNDSAP